MSSALTVIISHISSNWGGFGMIHTARNYRSCNSGNISYNWCRSSYSRSRRSNILVRCTNYCNTEDNQKHLCMTRSGYNYNYLHMDNISYNRRCSSYSELRNSIASWHWMSCFSTGYIWMNPHMIRILSKNMRSSKSSIFYNQLHQSRCWCYPDNCCNIAYIRLGSVKSESHTSKRRCMSYRSIERSQKHLRMTHCNEQ